LRLSAFSARRPWIVLAWSGLFVLGVVVGGHIFQHLQESPGYSDLGSLHDSDVVGAFSTHRGATVVVVDYAAAPAVMDAVASPARATRVGVVASCLLGVVVLFQLLLAAGAPWGAAAYGGRAAQDDGRLPPKYRVASLGTALALTGALWFVLAAAAVITPPPLPEGLLGIGACVLAGLFALNTLGNLAGRHPAERWGAGGITAALTISCVWIAATR